MRLKVVATAGVLALMAAAWPSLAAAQDRGKFWIGAGGGVGSATVSCEGCETDWETSGTGYFRFGGTVSERVLLGMEVNLWNKTYGFEGVEAGVNLYNISGTVTYYPQASGFFVRGGAGAAIADVDVGFEGTSVTVDVGTGFGLIGGVGYDVPIGRRWSITPGVNVWYGALGDTRIVGEPFIDNWKQTVVDFTIGITFR